MTAKFAAEEPNGKKEKVQGIYAPKSNPLRVEKLVAMEP